MRNKYLYLFYLILVILMILFLFSCATAVKGIKIKRKTDEILEEIKRYNNRLINLNLNGIVILKEKDGNNTRSFRIEIYDFKNPEVTRIDLKDFIFKKPLVTLISDGKNVKLFDYLKKKRTIYEDSSLFFEKIFDVKLDSDFALDLLTMRIPLLAVKRVKSRLIKDDKIVISDDKREEIIEYKMLENIVPLNIIYKNNNDLVSISYSNTKKVNNVEIPHKLSISINKRMIEISYKTIKVNLDYKDNIVGSPF